MINAVKKLGLDLGQKWVGVAISDSLGLLSRPLKTIAEIDLYSELIKIFDFESIDLVVVGLPVTMRATDSEQTKNVRKQYDQLVEKFSSLSLQWVLWDERFSSQFARRQGGHLPGVKLNEHARAAAYILQSYLDFLAQSAARE